MKIIKRDLGKSYKEIQLLALSDFHIGDKLCNLYYLPVLASQEGFEPPTYGLEGRCSILLSYWPIFYAKHNWSE